MLHTTLSRVAVAGVLAAAALSVAAGALSLTTTRTAYAADEVACNGDHALEDDGYACSPLLNKGTGSTIGEAFSIRAGSVLTIYTNLFSPLSDDGHSEQKLCVDDDDDPFDEEESCLGDTAEGHINDDMLVPAPANQEEDDGEYEFLIEDEQLEEFSGAGSSAGLGGYAVNVSSYTYFSFHFDEAQYSVETFLQPEDDGPETETPEVTKTGGPGRTSTVVRTTTAVRTTTPTVTGETETPTSTPTLTSTSTSTSTSTPGNGTTTTNRPPPNGVGGSTTTPPTATPVNTVLAQEVTPTASAIGVSLPAAGGGGSMDMVRDNLPLLLLSMWLIVLVIVGGAVTQRRGL
ncbi:MAG: hypothetical protein WEB52_01565 [Dehalococcoidia bacterium]